MGLTSLDISSNFFSDTSNATEGLASLPALTDLFADITPNDEKIVYENLRQLQKLNGVDLHIAEPDQIPSRPPRRQEISLTEKDLRKVVELYGAIRELRGHVGEDLNAELTKKFDRHIQETMEELTQKLDAVVDPRMKDPFLRQGEMLLAKHKLYELCFDELCVVADSHDPKFGQGLRKMKTVHEKLFNEYPGVLHEMRPHYKRRLADMQDEVVRAERETAQLLQAAEMLEKEAEAHSEQKELMAEKFEQERNRLLQENKRLREANARLATSGAGATDTGNASRNNIIPQLNGASKKSPTKVSKAADVRDLSLKQLKDHITAIFASKLAFDAKCKDAHLPRETMEQHMYTYLNHKYGLRTLIVEHATSIVKAMHMYSEKDNDVDVFKQIYENRIDEEFRFVQQRLKETVQELLRVYLKGKYPRKTDDAINELLDLRLNGYVYAEEWEDIVKYMYNKEDSQTLMSLIENTIRAQPDSPKPSLGRGHPRSKQTGPKKDAVKLGKVKYSHFLHHLLTFQLSGHRAFLQKFHTTFKRHDEDNNGVLNEEQMRTLVRDVDPSKKDHEIDEIINKVDPYNNQNITYSECVNVLSSELVNSMQRS